MNINAYKQLCEKFTKELNTVQEPYVRAASSVGAFVEKYVSADKAPALINMSEEAIEKELGVNQNDNETLSRSQLGDIVEAFNKEHPELSTEQDVHVLLDSYESLMTASEKFMAAVDPVVSRMTKSIIDMGNNAKQIQDPEAAKKVRQFAAMFLKNAREVTKVMNSVARRMDSITNDVVKASEV